MLRDSGYTVRDACEALGVSRSGYYASVRVKGEKWVSEGVVRDGDLLERIKAIKTGPPFWGYRRVWAWLRYREDLLVNSKRVRRWMKENGLMVNLTIHPAIAGQSGFL